MTATLGDYRLSTTLGEILTTRAQRIEERRKEPEKYRPIPTHIPALNDIIGGIPVNDPFYMLLFSSEKIGKTTVGMDLADAWRKGTDEPVLYIQLEELAGQYADRTFASMTSLTRRDLRMFDINDSQMQEIHGAAKNVVEGKNNLLLQDDLFSMYAIVEEMKRIRCKKAVLDNLQLVDQQGFQGSNSQERLAAISRYLVKLRNKEGFSFIVISQMGQEGRAFGSGQANRDADLLIQIENVYETTDDDEDEDRVVEGLRCLHVKPSRISGGGKCEVTFDGNKNKIGPVTLMDVNSKEFADFVADEARQSASQLLM